MTVISFPVPPYPTFIKGGEAIFRNGEKHVSRTYPVFDLLYVKHGTLWIKEEDKTFEVGSGEYIILIPNRFHGGYKPSEKDTEFIWIHFELPSYQMTNKTTINWSNCFQKEGSFTKPTEYTFFIPQSGKTRQRDRLEQLLNQIVQLEKSLVVDKELQQQIIFSEVILQLQKDALSVPSTYERVCERVLSYIHQNYSKPLKLQEVAKILHYHPDYMTRCVKRTIGMNLSQYIMYYRISKAKEMLLNTSQTISSIAQEVGYEDITYFSRVFKKLEGITPQQFRRMMYRI